MNRLKRHRKLIIIGAILIAVIGLFVFGNSKSGQGTQVGDSIRRATAFVQEPLKKGADKIRDGSSWIFAGKDLAKKNEELRQEIYRLKAENIKLRLTKAELDELRQLWGIMRYEDSTLKEKNFVTADVIAMDGSNWFNIFTINKGQEAGIKEDDTVVAGDGLVGRVIETGKGYSKVMSIIDEGGSTSFRVTRDLALIGIAKGDGKGGLKGFMLDGKASVIDGDSIISTDMGIYPEGIEIGKVKKVKFNNDTQLKEVEIESSVAFKSLRRVAVLI